MPVCCRIADPVKNGYFAFGTRRQPGGYLHLNVPAFRQGKPARQGSIKVNEEEHLAAVEAIKQAAAGLSVE